jgi:hypothetical protein
MDGWARTGGRGRAVGGLGRAGDLALELVLGLEKLTDGFTHALGEFRSFLAPNRSRTMRRMMRRSSPGRLKRLAMVMARGGWVAGGETL